MTRDDAEERNAAAGEYVLGTLSKRNREVFEREMQQDPTLLADIYFWQDKLVALTDRVPPMEPERRLWPAIEATLAPAAREVVVLAGGARRPARHPATNGALWRRLRRWQLIGGCATATSAVLATSLVTLLATQLGPKMLTPPDEAAARYLALLQAPQDRSTGWIVEVTGGDHVRLIPVGPTPPVPPGKTLQFWTKPEGATGPTSLGLITAGRKTELPTNLLSAVGEKQLFELTLEPEIGSPINKPTGPVLFVGKTVRL